MLKLLFKLLEQINFLYNEKLINNRKYNIIRNNIITLINHHQNIGKNILYLPIFNKEIIQLPSLQKITDTIGYSSYKDLIKHNPFVSLYELKSRDKIKIDNNSINTFLKCFFVPLSNPKIILNSNHEGNFEIIKHKIKKNNLFDYLNSVKIKILGSFLGFEDTYSSKWFEIIGYIKDIQINLEKFKNNYFKKRYDQILDLKEKLCFCDENFKNNYFNSLSIIKIITFHSNALKDKLNRDFYKLQDLKKSNFNSLALQFDNANIIHKYNIIFLLFLDNSTWGQGIATNFVNSFIKILDYLPVHMKNIYHKNNLNFIMTNHLYVKIPKQTFNLTENKNNKKLITTKINKKQPLKENISKESNNIIKDEKKLNELELDLKQRLEKWKDVDLKKLKEVKPILYFKWKLDSCLEMPKNVREICETKYQHMKEENFENSRQYYFINSLIEFPWVTNQTTIKLKTSLENTPEERSQYLDSIEDKLNKYIYEHKKGKKMLIDLVGQWMVNKKTKGKYIGLYGPPGTGKTKFAQGIGEALGLPFLEIHLGGQSDGELLIGHGFTYSNAEPGLIFKNLLKAKKPRCVIFFDELDKTIAKGGKEDEIQNILIHLTDPATNNKFQDRFFQGIDFDLSNVIFIFSYNEPEKVHHILLERIDTIETYPYMNKQKITILNKFILPKILIEDYNFPENSVLFEDSLIDYIIDQYTNEAGVRNIIRLIKEIISDLNILRLRGKISIKKNSKHLIDKDYVDSLFKENNKLDIDKISNTTRIGIINGLYAQKNFGIGGIINIQIMETGQNNSAHQFIYTGNQGKIMKESNQVAFDLSEYLFNNSEEIPCLEYYINKLKKINIIVGLMIKRNIKISIFIYVKLQFQKKDLQVELL